jgi:hypothetical protein
MIPFLDIPNLARGEILIYSKFPTMFWMQKFFSRWKFEIGDEFEFHSYKGRDKISLIYEKKDRSMKRRIIFTEEEIYECFDTKKSFRNKILHYILS